MDRRRIIGIVLLVLAAVVCLVSNVWFIIKMPTGGVKIAHLLLRTLPEVVIIALVAYVFTHPNTAGAKAHLSLRERRIKLMPFDSIDPNGYRFVSYGAVAMLVTIAFTVDILKLLGISPFANTYSVLAIIVFGLATITVVIWTEVKAILAEMKS